MILYGKIKIHIRNIAKHKGLSFTFYTFLNIMNRRRTFLPRSVFIKDVTRLSEAHLIKYMSPKHNGCFIDIGANIGRWTFSLARRRIKVYAFEPSPKIYDILKNNAKEYGNVHLYNLALGEGNYDAEFLLHYICGHDSLVKKDSDFTGERMKVKVRTLDSFNIQNVGLIKIDTEGYEVPILLGAKNTILKNKPRLVIEVHPPYKKQLREILKILRGWNYKWKIRFNDNKPPPHIVADSKSA